MKSKSVTYILIVLLLVIWGLIFKRVFFEDKSQSADKDIHTRLPQPTKPSNNYQTLLLNYPDPFLDEQEYKIETDTNDVQVIAPVVELVPNLDASYLGRIASVNLECFIIRIDNTTHSVMRGETFDGFSITKVFDDSIYITKNGLTHCVK